MSREEREDSNLKRDSNWLLNQTHTTWQEDMEVTVSQLDLSCIQDDPPDPVPPCPCRTGQGTLSNRTASKADPNSD